MPCQQLWDIALLGQHRFQVPGIAQTGKILAHTTLSIATQEARQQQQDARLGVSLE